MISATQSLFLPVTQEVAVRIGLRPQKPLNQGAFLFSYDIYGKLSVMKLFNIYKEILTEDFKSQTLNFIKQGIEADLVKSYIDKFKYIRDNKFKEMFDEKLDIPVPPQKRNDIDAYKDFHDLERLVDYVGGRRQGVSKLGKKEEIEVDAKPVYEDDTFVVYYADTPRA